MKLYFSGHQETYAVEQTLLTLFPQERPSYPSTPPGGGQRVGALLLPAPRVVHRHGGAAPGGRDLYPPLPGAPQ